MTTPGNSGNGYPPEIVKGFIGRIEECEAEIMREHMAYMGKVKELREDIGEILEEAKTKGIPRKALRLVVKTRKKQAELERIREDLEGDEQDQYDLIQHALGDLADTAIGRDALSRAAAKKKKTGEAVDELAGGAKH